MKTALCILPIVLLIPTAGVGADINPATDLSYVGAFQMPSGHHRYVDGMTFNPAGDSGNGSLIAVSASGNAIEMSIPTPKDDTYANLNASTVLAPPTDITDCHQGLASCCTSLDAPFDCCTDLGTGCSSMSTSQRLFDVEILPQQTGMSEDKLLYILRDYFSPEAGDNTIGWTDIDFSSGVSGQAGNWHVSDIDEKGCGRYITYINNSSWADTHANSRNILVGRFRGCASAQSWGIAAYAVAPWASCGGNPADCDAHPPAQNTALTSTKLIYYDVLPASDYHYDRIMDQLWREDRVYDSVWINYGGKEALLFSISKGDRWVSREANNTTKIYYGYAGPDGPRNGGSKGYKGEPYYGTIVFYRPSDLQSYNASSPPQPYARMHAVDHQYNNSEPGMDASAVFSFTGMAFDSSTGKLYVAEKEVDDYRNDHSVVHVFQLSTQASSADRTAPSVPTNPVSSSVSKTSATIGWDAAADANGGIAYEVYVNGVQLFLTGHSSLVHSNFEYYIAPVTYEIEAWDRAMNRTAKARIDVTALDGGNAPLTFYTHAYYSTSGYWSGYHPNALFPTAVSGAAYDYSLQIEGGVAQYLFSFESNTHNNCYLDGSDIRWASDDADSGLNFDASTGVFSGTPNSTKNFNFDLKIADSAGNVHVRICRISVAASSDDQDRDGYDSMASGGPDTDDLNCNINPDNPTFPAPTGVSLSAHTLSWTLSDRSELSAYKIRYGDTAESLTNELFVGHTDRCDVSNIDSQYFAVVAVTITGLESSISRIVNNGGETLDGGENLDGDTPAPPDGGAVDSASPDSSAGESDGGDRDASTAKAVSEGCTCSISHATRSIEGAHLGVVLGRR